MCALVVCSNKSSDANTVSRDQSIFKPYSFRNALSSTMKLPKNCQVALESVRYNLDGTVSLSGDSYIMYMYFAETPFEDADDSYPMWYSTGYPIRIPLIPEGAGEVRELSYEDLVSLVQSQINKFIFHPNLRDRATCSIVRDATTNELSGIKIDIDEFNTITNTVPTNASEFGDNTFLEDGADAGWRYLAGEFTTVSGTTNENAPAVAILTDKPITVNQGAMIVDFSAIDGTAVDWRVGLSRYINPYAPNSGLPVQPFYPMYFSADDGHDEGPIPGADNEQGFFADFLICNVGGTLKLCHTQVNTADGGSENEIKWLDVVYGNHAVAGDYDIGTNADGYVKVKFKCQGQQIKIFMIKGDGTEDKLYEYASDLGDNEILKPINQCCWTMYPVLSIERTATQFGDGLTVDTFNPCSNILNHNILDENNSWFQSQFRDPYGESAAQEVETRPWNDENATAQYGSPKTDWQDQVGINGSNVIDLPLTIITKPSALYTPTPDANTGEILGITTGVKDFGFIASPTTTRRLQSTVAPRLLSAKTMFVRLENFTTETTNALMGNRSKIIAHLPRFDGQVETGRIFHQPAERVYLDLNNSEPLNVNSFDISFCYSNEQYATSLSGQSVVVLHFKEKGS